MSRYTLQDKTNSGLEIVVGYDPPLNTFFGYVLKPGPPDNLEIEDENLVWVGVKPYECTTVESVAAAIAAYADIPNDVVAKLIEDSQIPYVYSPLQLLFRSLMS